MFRKSMIEYTWYQIKDLALFLVVAFTAFGLLHFIYTIVCGLYGLDRIY